MKTSDFYYDLPKELIAQDPLEDRSSFQASSSFYERRIHGTQTFYRHSGLFERRDCLVSMTQGLSLPSLRTQRRNRCTDRDPAFETP